MEQIVLSTSLLVLVFIIHWKSELIQKSKNIQLLAFSILLIIATFFRYDGDTKAYIDYLNYFPSQVTLGQALEVLKKEPYEYSFVLLNLILRILKAPSFLLFFICCGISLYVQHINIRKYGDLASSAVIIFISTHYLYNELLQIRQGVGVALFILSLHLISAKKPFAAFSSQLLAFSFHRVSSLSFISFLFNNLLSHRSIYLIGLFFSIIFGLFFDMKEFLLFLDSYGLLHWKAKSYVTSQIFTTSLSPYTFRVLRSLFVSGLLIYFWNSLKNDRFLLNLSKSYLIGAVLQFLFIDMYILSIRSSQFFMISEIILIPFLAKNFFPNKYKELCLLYSLVLLSKNLAALL